MKACHAHAPDKRSAAAQAGELPLPTEVFCYAPALISSLAIKDAAGLLPPGLLAAAALRLMPALIPLSTAVAQRLPTEGKPETLSSFMAALGVTFPAIVPPPSFVTSFVGLSAHH
jgi:hypothetical protein